MTLMDPLDPDAGALVGIAPVVPVHEAPENALALTVDGVTEVFRPRILSTISAMATEAKVLVGAAPAEERIDVRIGVHAATRGAAAAREVADVLLDGFPAATRIEVQIARIR
ncbi:hypothetical protein LQ938_01720 [Microbacterium sp. cx-55]|uniref:hypothetical protein n=1 Tax=unclassified Microbacterium TaxID=2609290 RepID=UPI001CBE6DE9|nr:MULTISPECIES: hypothetical protein [unclassified Microbacterium]MBZ4487523.1 hypothetical protein [Microbacterium sp. cx-55]MCC4908339.1 hypothetical protein [Microbacterium sp. cx-59]UGB35543.1 hypothetical protein LQ938_01720 [Microbacterium sp. cx-55]